MELWDAYNKDGTLAGAQLTRGEPIPEGLYHLVSQVLVRHTDGMYLLMRRDSGKPNWGGYFEATAGGSAKMGEDAVTCARRELLEETGIAADRLEPIGEYISHDTIYRNFLCVTNGPKVAVALQEGETVAAYWVSEASFMAFVNSDHMIPSQKEHFREYYVKMGYLLE